MSETLSRSLTSQLQMFLMDTDVKTGKKTERIFTFDDLEATDLGLHLADTFVPKRLTVIYAYSHFYFLF